MNWIYTLIGTPLGYVMWVCYALVQNVGWAIIIFTLIVRVAMFPMSLKQQKTTAISQLYMPRVKEIQTKYKNNKEKQQEELMKLQKEGYNPAGGCLPMILTMVILFGVIDVVYKPMTHMEHFSSETITSIVTAARDVDAVQTILANDEDCQLILDYLSDESAIAYKEWDEPDENGKTVKANNRIQITDKSFDLNTAKKAITKEQTEEALRTFEPLLKSLAEGKSVENGSVNVSYAALYDNSSRLSDVTRGALQQIVMNYADSTLYRELRALNCYDRSEGNKELILSRSGVGDDNATRFDKLSKNMIFLGINLGEQPRLAFDSLIIIPIISFIFSFAQILLQQYLTKKQNPELAKQQGSMTIMLLIMPFFSLWIVFSVPAGAGFYWSVSYLFAIVQSLIMYKFWPSDKIRAEAKAKMDAEAAKREQKTTIITVDADGNTTEKTERISKLSQKEIKELNKKKLEAARRADAEKYGEEYIESPDDDDI